MEESLKPQSAKAKGRNLQQFLRDSMLKIGMFYGLEPGDIESRSMGANGVDVMLSPAAQKVFGNVAIECKNQESLNVPSVFYEHSKKYPDRVAWLVTKKNHKEPLVTLRLADFLGIYVLQSIEWGLDRK